MSVSIRKLVIVGLGSIGRRHAAVVKSLWPDAKILALRRSVADIPPGVDRVTSDLDEALRFSPDAAVIASPAPSHLTFARAFLSVGVATLVEKPLSDSSSGAAALVTLARDKAVPLLIGYNLRFSKSLRAFRQLVQRGGVGRVLSVRSEVGQHLQTWRPGSDYRQSVSARRDLGGGALLELSHEVDYLRWIFGDVCWVQGTMFKQSELEMDVEDLVHATLGFQGRAGHSAVGMLTMDLIRFDSTRSCTVVGDQGTLRWDGILGRVDRYDAAEASWRTEFDHKASRDETYRLQWAHFADCIYGKEEPIVSGRDGLAVLEIVDAIRRANETKTLVALKNQEAFIA